MRRDQLLLAEITAAAERIVELTSGRHSAQVESDRDRRDALMWNFTVLGEAVGRLSDKVKSDHPDVPWSDTVRLRNRIVHGYWSIDVEVLVTTAHDDMPAFLADVRAIDVHEGDVDH